MVFLSVAAPFLLIQGGTATGEVHGWSIANGGDAVVNIEGKIFDTDANWRNSFGIFFADEKGIPFFGKIHSADSKTDAGKTFVTEIKNSEIPSEAKKFGFFVIPDGKTLNSELENGNLVTFSKEAPYAAELNGKKLVGNKMPVLFSDKMLNDDGKTHVLEKEDEGTNLTTLSWEDGYDTSFDDLVINIKVTGEHVFPIEPKQPAIPDAAPEKNTVKEQKKKSCPNKYTQSMHQGDSSEVECKQWCDDEGESCKCYSIDTNNTCRLYKDLAVKEQKKKSCDEHKKKAVENVSEVVQNPQNQQLAP
jgi:hypothetical protein